MTSVCESWLCSLLVAPNPLSPTVPGGILLAKTAGVVEGFGSDSSGQFWSISRHSIILSALGQSCPRTQRDCLHSCPETGMLCNDSGPRGV